ncbi:hypothetical protein GCM10025792_11180 [Pseudonocardia tropica]
MQRDRGYPPQGATQLGGDPVGAHDPILPVRADLAHLLRTSHRLQGLRGAGNRCEVVRSVADGALPVALPRTGTGRGPRGGTDGRPEAVR